MYRKPYTSIRIGFILVAIGAMCIAAATALGDSIQLMRSVRLTDADTHITLADIAKLDGDEAQQLADTVVASIGSGTNVVELHIDDIRAALDAAGVNWGKVHLNGGDVLVRPMRPDSAGGPVAMQPLAIDERLLERAPNRSIDTARDEDRAAIEREMVSRMVHEPTVRGMIAAMAQRQLRQPGERVRLKFDERDEATLALSTSDYRFEIQPQSDVTGGEAVVEVVAWRDGQPAMRERVRFSIRVLVDVAVARRDVPRGSMLMEEDIELRETWIPPNDAAIVAGRLDAVGRIASRDLHAGDPLRKQHIAQQTIVERGDTVTVRCLVGGIVITQRAEARTDGGEGDTIELRREGDRESFNAIVTGPGEAIVNLSRR